MRVLALVLLTRSAGSFIYRGLIGRLLLDNVRPSLSVDACIIRGSDEQRVVSYGKLITSQ